MFTLFYGATLELWRQLYAIALGGRLADGMPIPPGLALEIKVRFPIVVALVARGRALSSTDFAGNQAVVAQLFTQQTAFTNLARRFGMLSTISAATTAPWTRYNSIRADIIRNDPEAGAMLPALPSTPQIEWGLIIGVGVVGGLLLAANKL